MKQTIKPWLVAGGLGAALALAGCSDDDRNAPKHDVRGLFSTPAALEGFGSPRATFDTLTTRIGDAPLAAVAALNDRLPLHDVSGSALATRAATADNPSVTRRDCPLGGYIEERVSLETSEDTTEGWRDSLREQRSLQATDCVLLLTDGRSLRLTGRIMQETIEDARWTQTAGSWQESVRLEASMSGTVPGADTPAFVLSGETGWQTQYAGETLADGRERWSGSESLQAGRLEGLFVEADGTVVYGGWLDVSVHVDLQGQSTQAADGERIQEAGSAGMTGRFGSSALGGSVTTTTPTTLSLDFDSDRDSRVCPSAGVIRHEGAQTAEIRYGTDAAVPGALVTYRLGEASEGSTECAQGLVLGPAKSPFPDLRF